MAWVAKMKTEGADVLDDQLQKEQDPVAKLKSLGDRMAVVVPYEWLWPDNLAPFKNPEHKKFYDADSLTEDLEGAGYKQSVLRVLQVDNFAFLIAIGIRQLNSEERRRQKRLGLQTKKVVIP